MIFNLKVIAVYLNQLHLFLIWILMDLYFAYIKFRNDFDIYFHLKEAFHGFIWVFLSDFFIKVESVTQLGLHLQK